MKTRNGNVVLLLKLLKHVTEDFIGLFVSIYFLQISSDNITSLTIYRIIMCSFIIIVFWLFSGVAKTKYKIYLLRISLNIDLLYFALIIFLNSSMSKYYILMGIIVGIHSGLFWVCFNVLEAEGVELSERRKFAGMYTAIKSALNIIFPITLGTIIYYDNFKASAIIMIVLVSISTILSFMYSDTKTDMENIKFNIKKPLNRVLESKQALNSIIMFFCIGFTYSEGAFRTLAIIFIYKTFNNTMSVGWISALSSIISFIIGTLLIKVLNTEKKIGINNTIITTAMCLSVISIVFYSNIITVTIFYFIWALYISIMASSESIAFNNIMNMDAILKQYKPEFLLIGDSVLYVGRLISHIMMIIYAVTDNYYILLLFIVPFVITNITANRSLKLQEN